MSDTIIGKIGRIQYLCREIEVLTYELDAGSKAWEDGTDPCAMAACDPSDQFVKGEERDRLVKELKELVATL